MNRLDQIAARVAGMAQMVPVVEETSQYRSLNDAAEATGDQGYQKGGTKIWYMKPDFFRDGSMGYDWLTKHEKRPNRTELTATHRFIGQIREMGLDKVFAMMQGESWSPEGQARSLIRRMGVGHTSMSVGDIIEHGGKLMFVDSVGFKELT